MQPMQLPAKMETVVKNTFLEISDGSPLAWSRQMSEPVKKVSCWSRQISVQSQATASDWDEWDEERTTAGGRSTPKSGCASASSSSHRASDLAPERPPLAPPEQQPPLRHEGPPAGLSANTVTVRNVPAGYTKQAVVAELQDAGFRHGRDFDFLYVPRAAGDSTTSCFVNFTSAAVMHAFCAAFHGRTTTMRQFPGSGPVHVTATTPEDLWLLGGGPALGPGHSRGAAAPQGVPPAPAVAQRPVQISLMAVMPPAPPPQAWGQPRAAPAPPAGRLGQQPTAHAVVFCPQCGTKGEGKFRFCSQCGFCIERLRLATAQ
ncbi:unnamed protein product [Prorocentrum cordatum]|uniref:RRM domain-containing protein n=1 Tax=Prorocentrum cordatum TaxID=2364126 RepID=A0ABN9QGL9_9DINO|nr:unnamed protein product [Polarella glacialis]